VEVKLIPEAEKDYKSLDGSISRYWKKNKKKKITPHASAV
jgi:hypothetical protein